MFNANPIRIFIFVVVLSGFMLGVVKLFSLRFEAGDIYPAYSSLRSDPLGSRAFYSSLENMDGALVRRNYLPVQNLNFKQHTSFFYIGTPVFDSESVSVDLIEVFERVTNTGGRLVLSFLPVEKKPANWRMRKCFDPKEEIKNRDKARQNGPLADSESPSKRAAIKSASTHDAKKPETAPIGQSPDKPRNCVSLKNQWGLTFAFAEKPADKALNVGDAQSQTQIKELPQKISWHTAFYFDELEDAWRVIYTADGRPVIVERPYGKGSLVLSADSFFMSNEALRSERYPELLAWTLGQSATVVFDETHFGVFKQPGVLTLIQRYRFHWFILGVAVLALLFIWKNSVYFMPPPKNRGWTHQEVVSDRDSTQGLISLLRRNIPSRQLLQTCAREWERTFQPQKRFRNAKLAQVKSALKMIETPSSKSIDPVSVYRRISKLISKGSTYE